MLTRVRLPGPTWGRELSFLTDFPVSFRAGLQLISTVLLVGSWHAMLVRMQLRTAPVEQEDGLGI